MPAASIRARVRAEMTDEIKTVARQHLATDGANLSLRAVARDMGMVSSALYRYFPSRDDLLTALILDGYNALADAIEAADATVQDRAEFRNRWRAIGMAVRTWALARPAEYALLYGSPVPGYAAPPDTAVAATRAAVVLVRILTDGYASGALTASGDGPGTGGGELADGLAADLSRLSSQISPELPDRLLLAGITAWIQLFGVVSFELFGQFTNVIDARAEFFDWQLDQQAALIGF